MSIIHATEKSFDFLEAHFESERARRFVAVLAVAAFLGSIGLIELGEAFPAVGRLIGGLPENSFYAIHVAFTILLLVEVIGFVFSFAKSIATAVGKQFEIFALFMLRHSFEEFRAMEQPVQNVALFDLDSPIMHIVAEMSGALLIFVLLGYYRSILLHRSVTRTTRDQLGFVRAKKAVAMALLVAFALIGLTDLYRIFIDVDPFAFFDTFFTVLIFADILLVLISLYYTSLYPVVFRNFGFAVCTMVMRIALTAHVYERAILGIFATCFLIGLSLAYNRFTFDFGQAQEKEDEA